MPRTLGVALWEYRDHNGRRRRAYYGHTLDLPDTEVARGEHAGVFADPADTDNVAAQDHIAETSNMVATDPTKSELRDFKSRSQVAEQLPPRVSTNAALIDWLVAHRDADRATLTKLTKARLWQLIEQPKDAAHQ